VDAATPFAAWDNFYVIVGSSAAALLGLQFVVMVLGAELSVGGSEHVTSAFGTPNIVHFSAALLNAAIVSAPWRRVSSGGIGIAVFALVGLVYTFGVLRHARRQSDYTPVTEDWIFHFVLPLAAYVVLLGSGILLRWNPRPWLFPVGGASLLLLFVGIHNAWDSVTYIALVRGRRPERREREAAGNERGTSVPGGEDSSGRSPDG
jgi:hypothetical protein